jgi:putative transposase
VFNAPDVEAAEHRLKADVDRSRQTAPNLSTWMDENLPEGLNVFAVPKPHRRTLRTSNFLKNLNGKLRKNTSVVGLFTKTNSILRLASALLREIDEGWLTGKRYLNMVPKTND